jgi:hypothetical protein
MLNFEIQHICLNSVKLSYKLLVAMIEGESVYIIPLGLASRAAFILSLVLM